MNQLLINYDSTDRIYTGFSTLNQNVLEAGVTKIVFSQKRQCNI